MGRFDNLRQRLGYDAQLEAEGVVVVLDDDATPPVAARVLSVDHPNVERVQHAVTLEIIAGGGSMDSLEDARDKDVRVAAAMVAEWIGLRDDAGAPVTADPATNAEILLAVPEWRRKISQKSRNPRSYKRPTAAQVDAAGKRSGHTSVPAAS